MKTAIKIAKYATLSTAYYILIILITVQMLTGAFLIVLCEVIKFSLLKYFHEIQKNELNIRMYLIEFYSAHLIIFYLCGYTFAKNSLSEPYTDHLKSLLKFWNTLIFLLSIEGIITAWLCQESFESVAQSIEISLYRGIDAYYEDSNWRLIWDNLQFHNQCCGVKDYHDWEAITWMEYEMKQKRDKAITNLEFISLTPYSCCKLASSCYENLFSENDERSKRMQLHQLLNTNVSAINRRGCLNNLIDRIASILDLTIDLTVIVFIIQFLVSVLMALIFVTNRTYRGDGSDACSESSDMEDQITVSRLIAKNDQLRQQYCADYGFEAVHSCPQTRQSPSCPCNHGQCHEHRCQSQAHRGEHRRSSSLDPSLERRNSNIVAPDDGFRRSIIEPAEEMRRSVLSYEQRHGSAHPTEEHRRTGRYEEPGRFYSKDEHCRSRRDSREEARRSSNSSPQRTDEYRRRSLNRYDDPSFNYSEGEPRRSSVRPDEEPRRNSLGH